MGVQVKICGITTPEGLAAATGAGADFIGLVFYPPSPRHVTIEQAARLADMARGRARVVALTVDADDALLDEIAERARPDFWQLHGRESPARVKEIARRYGIETIKAFRLRGPEDLRQVADFLPHIAFPLFDAWHPPGQADLPGGMGKAFDWTWLKDHRGAFMLAGGLTPENVAEAIARTGAAMVDVSSGVERERGVKDPERIAAFVRAAKAAGRAS